MKIICAPDSFKGTLDAVEAAEAIASGVRQVMPYANVDCCPVGDGGAGEPSPLYASDEVFAGAVVHGPGAAYPSHVHKATEAFWIAAGTADWQLGDDWTSRGPGSTIFHPTGTRHACTTGAEAQVMLFAWTTDIDSIPVIIRH